MAVLNMKPHYLWEQTITGGYEDENGDYHAAEKFWSCLCKCDIVPSGEAQELTFADGSVKKYSHVVYLPKDVRDFVTDEKVKLVLFGKERTDGFDINAEHEYNVQGGHRYQHQYKLWVLEL